MQHLGAAAHALEDSYSNAHEFRGDAVFAGDPTAPIEALNVFHPLGLHHGPGGATDLVQGTHDHYLDAVPVGPGTGHRDAYSIAHNADGSVPLQHQSDLAGAHATAEMLERYEDHRDTAETGAQALGHAVDEFFQMDPSGVDVNDNFSDPSFQHELSRRVHIEQHQEDAAQHHANTYEPPSDHAWHDSGQLGDYESGGEAQQAEYEEA
jgi:hypothetical protein